MFKKNVSGQYVYFMVVSSVSGNVVYSGSPNSLSGKISGYISADGGAQAGIGGYITEDGFGQYHLNGFAADFNGNNLGFLFCTGSGIIPISLAVVTVGGISGSLWIGSGQFVNVYSGQISGQQVTLTSGQSFTASGINSTVPISSISGTIVNSGLFVTVPTSSISGSISTLISGVTYIASGLNAVVPISSMSGLIANSGLFVTVLPANLSGVIANSGLNVTVPISSISGSFSVVPIVSISGINAIVPPATLSGVVANSGLTVVVLPASISGNFSVVPISTISGTIVIAGTVNDKSGYTLTASGLDTIQVESGMNLRQAQSVIAAVLGGRLSGAGTTSVLIDGANVSGTNRVAAIVNQSGNRTAVTLNLPT